MTYSRIIETVARDMDLDPKIVEEVIDEHLKAIKRTICEFDTSNISWPPTKETDLAIHIGRSGYIVTSKAKKNFFNNISKHSRNGRYKKH